MKQVIKGLATRGDGNWLASTQGLPDGKQALAAGKTWKQVQTMLQEAAELVLKVPPGSVTVDMEFEDPELQGLVDEVHRAKAVLRDAQFEMSAAMGVAARALTKGATTRDVAEILGCSHQHVAKLAPKGREDEPGDTPKDWAKMLYLVAGLKKPMSTADLVREAREWGTEAGHFPDDPEFAEEVAREHREFIDWMAAPRAS